MNYALFSLNHMYMADRLLREVTFAYGIVPSPKYDEAQEEHIPVMANPFTLYMVMSDQPALAMWDNKPWTSPMKSNEKAFKTMLKRLVKKLDEIE